LGNKVEKEKNKVFGEETVAVAGQRTKGPREGKAKVLMRNYCVYRGIEKDRTIKDIIV